MKWLLTVFIRIYQLCLSPFMGGSCRFYPSCSDYALEALKVHGAWKGLWLIIKRLGKCHPWHRGGYDPIITRTEKPGRSGIHRE